VEYNNKSDTGSNTGGWNLLKIVQKIPEHHAGKARIQTTTKNNHIRHDTHSPGCTDVNYKMFIMGNSNYV
jgi:hypothetical protein